MATGDVIHKLESATGFTDSGLAGFSDYIENLSTAGMKFGTSTLHKLGFYGATPTIRLANADQAEIAGGHGNCYDITGATTTVTTSGVYYKLSNTTVQDVLDNFTHASNKLTYTGPATGHFHVVICVTAGYSGGAGAKTLAFRIGKNGNSASHPQTQISRAFSASTDRGSMTMQGLISLTAGDFIEVFGANITDDNEIVVDVLSIVILSAEAHTLANRLRYDLVTLGLIKGSA